MEELLSRCPRWVLPGRGDTALCAVSGGLDSMCLLDLLDQWCRERGANIAAAHFNHQLRGAASDRDERFVRDWCAAHDIPFASGDGDVKGFALSEGLSVEEAARELRYAFLRREAAKLGPRARIYTAHHADDQAETVLFNLIRGTGTAGLAGMAVYQGDLVRPLLYVRRSELAEYAAARGIPHVEDGTNADPEAAARNFLRLKVMPLLGELNPTLTNKVSYMVVSEAGASVYSASKLGAEEFPQFDVSLRSAVSIARRLQDPLAELVKIDPKAIGVGQYQHDMPPKQLDEALGGVVEDCVNRVGVDLNTASGSLLSYVAGVNQAVAKNIVAYREENGSFVSRSQLMKVPKLGKKAYEQCAGFLRVPESGNPLDHTGVHPESYAAAQKLLTLCGYRLEEVLSDEIAALPKRVEALGSTGEVAARIGVGEPTLRDMVAELVKPGRDPRDELPKPLLRTDVMELSDLKPGMVLTGTVRNVTDFGAFVDIAVHEDGLVHISQICNRYIRHPSEVLKVGDIVRVKVLDVDLKRKRISLTMKDLEGGEKR